jgi:hypothetical protein
MFEFLIILYTDLIPLIFLGEKSFFHQGKDNVNTFHAYLIRLIKILVIYKGEEKNQYLQYIILFSFSLSVYIQEMKNILYYI